MITPDVPAIYATPSTHTVQANGLKFAYMAWGDPKKPLVLCLHGFPDSPATWNTLAPALVHAGYYVVAPWTRGYYPTEVAPDGNDSAEALGRDALALIAALGSQKAVIVGHDWGALAAYAAATLGPTHVSKVVLVAIPHPKALTPDAVFGRANHFLTLPLPWAAHDFEADNIAGVDRIYKKWSPHWHPSAATVEAAKAPFRHPGGTSAILGYYRSFLNDKLGAAFGGPPTLAFADISMPSLEVYGSEDGAVEPRFFAADRPYFTGPHTSAKFEGVGHFPQAERPDLFALTVVYFLGQQL